MLTYCSVTDEGGRKGNEDACDTITFEHNNIPIHLLIVADGLGGYTAGEVASRLAVIELAETVKRMIPGSKTITNEMKKDLLRAGFKKASDEISYHTQIMPERKKMGTTLVAALLDDQGRGVVANVGDSRAYLVGDKIRRVTKDHSYVQELVDKGMITEDEAFDHPESNIVTKIIGTGDGEPDLYDIELGERILLLCSDGLSGALKDDMIRTVASNAGRKDICKNLLESAKPESTDNITVVAAWV